MTNTSNRGASTDLEVAIIGAGFSGLQMLHRAIRSQRSVRVYEAGGSVGGTWYWNRYPGCRVDVESLEYSYSFSDELQQDWEWSERYAAQPELLRYANHVADRFNLRPHIQLNTLIKAAVFDEATHRWTLTTGAGETVRAQFCILATGLLVVPNKPEIPGLETFRGRQLFTSLWPEDGVDLNGKKVCVIGTGSTAIQCIPEIAKVAAHLTVLQRTPSFSIPARNRPLDPRYQAQIKARYPELREKEEGALAGFISLDFLEDPYPTKNALEVTELERKAEYDRRWEAGGLCFYNAFKDLLFDPAANETLAEYVREKIRERVRDPKLAEKLVPKGFPILSKRLCADTNYFETYDRDNVSLVDIMETPIERVTPDGIEIGGNVIPCDVIVFATGFDALTGAIERINIRGRDGHTLKEHWSHGLRIDHGLMCSGFPNLIIMNGPGSPSAFNAPIRIAEYQADWIERCLDYLNTAGFDSIEARRECEDVWMDGIDKQAAATLFPATKSWYLGDNIPGKPHRMMIYLGGFLAYRSACDQLAADCYQNFILSRPKLILSTTEEQAHHATNMMRPRSTADSANGGT